MIPLMTLLMILLENIDKEIQINFSLLTTPTKDAPSISKTSTISKLENYINEYYGAVYTIKFLHLKVKLAF